MKSVSSRLMLGAAVVSALAALAWGVSRRSPATTPVAAPAAPAEPTAPAASAPAPPAPPPAPAAPAPGAGENNEARGLADRVDALVKAGRIGAARDATEEYLRRFPEGSDAERLERLTGVHPRPPMPNEPH